MLKNKEDFILGINHRKINNRVSTYAQIIRNERLRRHMTLEDASKDICSVSYLCKLENSLIKTNETFVRSLCERFNLNYDSISTVEMENLVEEVVKCVFLKKDDEIEELYQKNINIPFNSGTQIVNCFYYLLKNNFKAFEEGIKLLDNIKYTLTDIESVALLYLIILYNINKHNYLEAYNYLKLMDLIKINNKYLHYMIIEANIVVSYNINNYCRLINSYMEYDKYDMVGFPLGRKFVSKMINNVFMSDEFPNEVLDDVNSLDLSMVPSDSKLDVIYYIMIIRMKNGQLADIFREIIDKNYCYDARFMGLLAYISYRINKKVFYKELLELAENYAFEEVDIIHQKFVYFILLYSTSKNKEDIIKYMKDQINPYLNVEINPLYNKVYKQIYLEYLLSVSKYKESYYFLSQHLNY